MMPEFAQLAESKLIDWIIAPQKERKTGELIIAGAEDSAMLYYQRGALVHAVFNDQMGLDVLVEVLTWPTAECEFSANVIAPTRTLSGDLREMINQALALVQGSAADCYFTAEDEAQKGLPPRWKPDERQAASGAALDEQELVFFLDEFIGEHSFVRYICIMEDEGEILVAPSAVQDVPRHFPRFCGIIQNILEGYPRRGLEKIVFVDDLGGVIIECLDTDFNLVVFSDDQTSIRAASIEVEKLADLIGHA